MDQIDVAHHGYAKTREELPCSRIEKIVIHRAKNGGLAEDGGLSNDNVVHIPYRRGQGGIECDDFGDVTQEGDVLVNTVFSEGVKFPEARITENLCRFMKHFAGNEESMTSLEEGYEERGQGR